MHIYVWARYHAVVTLAHIQSNPFYHPFYPDVTHMRKDTRPSPAFLYSKRRKAGRGLGTRLSFSCTSDSNQSLVPGFQTYKLSFLAPVCTTDDDLCTVIESLVIILSLEMYQLVQSSRIYTFNNIVTVELYYCLAISTGANFLGR